MHESARNHVSPQKSASRRHPRTRAEIQDEPVRHRVLLMPRHVPNRHPSVRPHYEQGPSPAEPPKHKGKISVLHDPASLLRLHDQPSWRSTEHIAQTYQGTFLDGRTSHLGIAHISDRRTIRLKI